MSSAYADHRVTVLDVLERSCRWLDANGREAVFLDACAELQQSELDGVARSLHPFRLRGRLIDAALVKARQVGTRAWRAQAVAPSGKPTFVTAITGPARVGVRRRRLACLAVGARPALRDDVGEFGLESEPVATRPSDADATALEFGLEGAPTPQELNR